MPLTSPKILIADDDEGIIDATVMMLEIMDYQVSSTLDGAAVPELLKAKPDLLILDIWLSGVDGRDICKQIKANADTMNIPVLMISASKDIRESALASGANDFLEKPFEMEALFGKVAQLLN